MEERITWEEVPQFMAELRSLARALLRREQQAVSLQTTALVVTALRRQRLAEQDWSEVRWENRGYFFRATYTAMQRALVDHARRRMAQKQAPTRGVSLEDLHWHDLVRTVEEAPAQLVALDDGLRHLAQSAEPEQQWATLIEQRYYGGLTIEETARLLEVSVRTVQRQWLKARLWLHHDVLRRLQAGGMMRTLTERQWERFFAVLAELEPLPADARAAAVQRLRAHGAEESSVLTLVAHLHHPRANGEVLSP